MDKAMIRKVIGGLFVLFAILLPAISLGKFRPGILFKYQLFATLGVSALVAVSMFVVKLINKGTVLFIIIGYIAFIILSAIPAMAVLPFDKSYNALGMVYYNAIFVAILVWYGISLFNKKEI